MNLSIWQIKMYLQKKSNSHKKSSIKKKGDVSNQIRKKVSVTK